MNEPQGNELPDSEDPQYPVSFYSGTVLQLILVPLTVALFVAITACFYLATEI